ncbi:MAG TPA: hypothetical protein VHH36_05195 [Candidatus Thermoplasmatota archaeon]|nr:hypothetical protein [Candidatus Thermoplasmatota archaeon]
MSLRATNEFPVRTPPVSAGGGGGERIVDPRDGKAYPVTRAT